MPISILFLVLLLIANGLPSGVYLLGEKVGLSLDLTHIFTTNIMTLANRKLRLQITDSFPCQELLPGLVICESLNGDPHGWNNSERNKPPFIVYLGYNSPEERDGFISQLRNIWKIDGEIIYRAAKRVNGFWWEIKIRGMKRRSSPEVFDLDYFSESKSYGLDFLVHLLQTRLEN